MYFNGVKFFAFFAVVYSLYLLLRHRQQNQLLLVASYVFYAAWDWRFLSLIWISTFVDFICGLKIQASRKLEKRKRFLFLSVFTNLFILSLFKYFNFFASSLSDLLLPLGFSLDARFLQIVLPVGISFYTFQTMSYTIDIYRRKMKPTRHFADFALFVAFFPQLVAGPIERASHLLPQVLKPRFVTLDKFYEGCFLVYWGLFLKVVVADNLAPMVNQLFNNPGPYNGVEVLLASYAFAFQIFGDFAGYSSIARGISLCMGFDIMQNFNLPYFAKNPSDFWHRWHISLSSWLRDYLYIPLGGNRGSVIFTLRNLFLTMLLGGLWHGANWTFLLWGCYHGGLLVIYRLINASHVPFKGITNFFGDKFSHFVQIIFFFHLVCIGWIFFRANSVSDIFDILKGLLTNFHLQPGIGLKEQFLTLCSCLFLLLIVQFIQYIKRDLLVIYRSSFLVKAFFYFICHYAILTYGVIGGEEFIYFQF